MVKAEKDPKWALRVFKKACSTAGYRPILPLYDKLIEKLGRGKLFAKMAKILEQMKLESCKCTEGFMEEGHMHVGNVAFLCDPSEGKRTR